MRPLTDTSPLRPSDPAPTLLWASLASVVLRDRIIRPLILAAINSDAKNFLRSTFPRENGIFPTYIAALHSWRFKEEDVWSALTDLDKQLCSKKPRDKSIRDWRADMDKWRLSRRSLAASDIAQDIEHLWIMRCLETCSQEPWYDEYR